jgi:tetratricopeptide (TPR) repeat protein
MAIDHARAAYEQAPLVLAYGRLYGHLLMREGDNLGSQGRLADSARSLREALKVEERLIRQNPAVPDLRRELARTYMEVVANLPPERKPSESVPLLRQACELLESLPLAEPDQDYALVQLLATRGTWPEPTRPPVEDEARRRRDLDQAADALRRAIAGGFREPSAVRQSARSYYPGWLARADVTAMLADLDTRLKAETDGTAPSGMPAARPAAVSDSRPAPDAAATAAAHQRLQADLAASQRAIALIHLGMSKALQTKGDFEGALAEIREAIRLQPEEATFRTALDAALKAVADRDGFRREAAALKPNDFLGHSDLAQKLRGINDLDGAIAEWRAAIAIKPDVPQFHVNLALALRAKGDADGPLAEFREAVRLRPDDAFTRDWHGFLLNEKGNRDAAITEFRAAIRLDANLLSAHRNLGNALAATGDPAGALAEFRVAYQLKPDDSPVREQLVRLLKATGDAAGADAVLRAAVSDDESARHVASARKLEAKDRQAAIAEFRQALAIKPTNAEAQRSLADCLRQSGQVDASIVEYRKAIALEPERGSIHNNLGLALGGKGDHEGAIAEFRAAIRLDHGTHAVAHSNLARALMTRKDLDGAIAEYRELIRMQPENRLAHDQLGSALVSRGELDEALAVLRAAYLEPGAALAEYSGVLRRAGKLDEAVAAARESVGQAPDSVRAYQNLGAALLDKHDPAGAAAVYREAVRLKPDDHDNQRQLGVALAAAGDVDAAIPCYRESLRLKPDNAATLDNLLAALRTRRRRDASDAVSISGGLGLDPEIARAIDGLVAPLMEKVRPDQGLVLLDELARDHPNEPRFAIARAQSLIELGRRSDAAGEFARTLELVPALASPWSADDRAGVYPAAVADTEVFELLTSLRSDDRTLLIARVRHLGRQREWREAAAVATRLSKLDPTDNFSWHHEAALLSSIGDHEGYRRVCREMLQRFGSGADLLAARRTVLSCLLEPDTLSDLGVLGPLVERFSTSAPTNENVWSILAAGFFEYRNGRLDAAIERLGSLPEERATNPADEVARALACVIRAMAYALMDQADLARRQLTAAEALANQAKFDAGGAGPLNAYWNDWLRYQVLHREAEGLLRPTSGPLSRPADQ